MNSRYNSVGKLPTLRAIQPTNRGLISCRGNTFFFLSNVIKRLCGPRSLIHWGPGAISERQADNSKPSTIKTKKAWSYTFSTYFYQTWCLSRVKMAQILIVNIYILCMPLWVHSYKHGDGAKLRGYIRQIKYRHNIYLGSKFFTETNCSSSSCSSSSIVVVVVVV